MISSCPCANGQHENCKGCPCQHKVPEKQDEEIAQEAGSD